MSAETAFLIAFFAVVVVIILLVLAALMFEADGDPPAPEEETAKPGDESGETAGTARKSARALALRVGEDVHDVPAEPGVAGVADLS